MMNLYLGAALSGTPTGDTLLALGLGITIGALLALFI